MRDVGIRFELATQPCPANYHFGAPVQPDLSFPNAAPKAAPIGLKSRQRVDRADIDVGDDGMGPDTCSVSHRAPRLRIPVVLLLPLVATGLTIARPLRAQTVAADGEGSFPIGQRAFGVGATAGVWSGAGVTVAGGSEVVKGWVTAGYAPVMVFANAKADKALRFNYYHAVQLGADLAIPVKKRARLEVSLLLGYKFNSVLGHGGGAGLGLLYDLSRHLGLAIAGGLNVFPSAQDRLDRNQGYPTDRNPSLTPAIQGGGNIGLVFYP